MSARREIEFPWADGATIVSRPTLGRVSQMEAKFGPILGILDLIRKGELSVTQHGLPMLCIILRGCEGAPNKDSEIQETAFELGLGAFTQSIIEWVVAAYTVNDPPGANTEGK